jgi:uncharacterized protein YfdQ (DUF2303 family)
MPDMILKNAEFEVAMAAGRAVGEPYVKHGGVPFVVVPKDYNIQSIEHLLPKPERKRGTANLATAASFIAYVNEHKSPASRIFAQVTDNHGTFCAILDFHGVTTDQADWSQHQANFSLESTVEWKRVMASNTKRMTQVDFAIFLEENQNIIHEPNGAKLMELVLALEGRQEASFTNVQRLQNGSCKLNYEENVAVKGITAGAIEMPALIEFGVAPFVGVKPFRIESRLHRIRLEQRKLQVLVRTGESTFGHPPMRSGHRGHDYGEHQNPAVHGRIQPQLNRKYA